MFENHPSGTMYRIARITTARFAMNAIPSGDLSVGGGPDLVVEDELPELPELPELRAALDDEAGSVVALGRARGCCVD